MNERIKVVLLEPDREAKIAEIETTLESMLNGALAASRQRSPCRKRG